MAMFQKFHSETMMWPQAMGEMAKVSFILTRNFQEMKYKTEPNFEIEQSYILLGSLVSLFWKEISFLSSIPGSMSL